MKRILMMLLTLLLTMGYADCIGENADALPTVSEREVQPTNESESTVMTLEGFPWAIELRRAEIRESLYTQAGLPQYDGTVLDVDYNDSPSEGNVFLILTLTIVKTGTGGKAFEWQKLSVEAADGNAYSRMENDAFLQNHMYNRMPSTPLQIGETKGSVCFEIPEEQATSPFTLRYDAGNAGVLELTMIPS